MRPDMAKVVTEAPRRGHGASSRKTGHRLTKDEIWNAADEEPLEGAQFGSSARGAPGERLGGKPDLSLTRTKESQGGQYGWDSKSFSDVLGPLRGYLRKQVGRPWDKVYSELSQTLDKRSITGLHIWDHIRQEVALNAEMLLIDGKLIAFERSRFGARTLPVNGLYVHPWTGILRRQQHLHRYGFWLDRMPRVHEAAEPFIKLDDGAELRRISGIWYRCTFEKVSTREPAYWRTFSYSGKDTHHRYFHEAKDVENVTLIHKRQLSKGQLKTYGVTNEATPHQARRRRGEKH